MFKIFKGCRIITCILLIICFDVLDVQLSVASELGDKQEFEEKKLTFQQNEQKRLLAKIHELENKNQEIINGLESKFGTDTISLNEKYENLKQSIIKTSSERIKEHSTFYEKLLDDLKDKSNAYVKREFYNKNQYYLKQLREEQYKELDLLQNKKETELKNLELKLTNEKEKLKENLEKDKKEIKGIIKFDDKNWQNLLYVAYGKSLDFLSGLSANDPFYQVSIMVPTQFHNRDFFRDSEKGKDDLFFKGFVPSGFGFRYTQGQIASSQKNPIFTSYLGSDTSWIKETSKAMPNKETKVQAYFFWGNLLKNNNEKGILRPAILGELRKKYIKEETERVVYHGDKLDPSDTLLLNGSKINSESSSTQYFYGAYIQAEALDMNISSFMGYGKEGSKLIQMNAIHKNSGLLIGGEVRPNYKNHDPEFEVHVALAFGIDKLLGFFGDPEISGDEEKE